MDINELIDDFLEHLEVERGRSKRTIENYRLYLYRFYEICTEILGKENILPSEITPELLRKYRLKLNRYENAIRHEGLKAITQAYHLIALRGFLKGDRDARFNIAAALRSVGAVLTPAAEAAEKA